MAFLNKSTSDSQKSDDKWKVKYLDLLDEHEQTNHAYQKEQDLLCKTIIRLSLAVKGLDAQLDPHLQHIRKQLKSGLKTEQLKEALTEFSNALLKFEDAQKHPHQQNASLLFEFLGKQYPEQKSALDELEIKYANNHFTSNADFFHELANIFTPADNATANNTLDSFTPALIEPEFLRSELLELIDSIDIPAEFSEQASSLSRRLHSPTDNLSFKPILEDSIKLFQNIKKFQQDEQLEMAKFLSSLTEQLAELSIKASGARDANQDVARKRNLLDESVSAQMTALQQSSADATTLDVLKHIVTTRITSITAEIQEHAKNEYLQRIEAEKQLQELTQKIVHLDAESKELKTKLIVAHSKATRDPLTNLPNRLAYDETLSNEIARWKRYSAAFSLLIWDIDLFKNINDTYGHKAGDKTLIIIANLLSKYCRESDFVARIGGEEFVMVLPSTDEQSALVLADKIREIIAHTGFNSNGQKINITISCGISQYRETDNQETLFERADQALYKAKKTGRNRCLIGN